MGLAGKKAIVKLSKMVELPSSIIPKAAIQQTRPLKTINSSRACS